MEIGLINRIENNLVVRFLNWSPCLGEILMMHQDTSTSGKYFNNCLCVLFFQVTLDVNPEEFDMQIGGVESDLDNTDMPPFEVLKGKRFQYNRA